MLSVKALRSYEKNSSDQQPKKKNADPLSKYPLRLCAYSNEVGAALSPINPALGVTLWAPALMYFGADIYDKYKNDHETYAPSKERGFEQAVFQALSSILLPTTAIRAGQKIASRVIPWNKSELSPDVQKELIGFTLNSIKENKLSDNTPDSLKTILKRNFKNKLNNTAPEVLNETPLKKLSNLLFESSDPVHSLGANQSQLMQFLDDKVDEIYLIKKNLMEGTITDKTPKKMHKYFQKQIKKLKDKYPTNYTDKAAKSTINKVLKDQNFRINIPATIGGFAALAIAAVPIDIFVEKIIVSKMVKPGIQKFDNTFKGWSQSRSK